MSDPIISIFRIVGSPLSLLFNVVLTFARTPFDIHVRASNPNFRDEAMKFFVECLLLRIALTSLIFSYALRQSEKGSPKYQAFSFLDSQFGFLSLPFAEVSVVFLQFFVAIATSIPAARFLTTSEMTRVKENQIINIVLYHAGLYHLYTIITSVILTAFLFYGISEDNMPAVFRNIFYFITPYSIIFSIIFSLLLFVNVKKLSQSSVSRILFASLIWISLYLMSTITFLYFASKFLK